MTNVYDFVGGDNDEDNGGRNSESNYVFDNKGNITTKNISRSNNHNDIHDQDNDDYVK